MYSLHLRFQDLEIGKKFQIYCQKAGIYCTNAVHFGAKVYHVSTEDRTFFEQLNEFAKEHPFLERV